MMNTTRADESADCTEDVPIDVYLNLPCPNQNHFPIGFCNLQEIFQSKTKPTLMVPPIKNSLSINLSIVPIKERCFKTLLRIAQVQVDVHFDSNLE
uniref:Uncharacterized protein n=1 Tax=Daphnia magna TaxID=35525 RepID=A0A0N8DSL8_9CRUS